MSAARSRRRIFAAVTSHSPFLLCFYTILASQFVDFFPCLEGPMNSSNNNNVRQERILLTTANRLRHSTYKMWSNEFHLVGDNGVLEQIDTQNTHLEAKQCHDSNIEIIHHLQQPTKHVIHTRKTVLDSSFCISATKSLPYLL